MFKTKLENSVLFAIVIQKKKVRSTALIVLRKLLMKWMEEKSLKASSWLWRMLLTNNKELMKRKEICLDTSNQKRDATCMSKIFHKIGLRKILKVSSRSLEKLKMSKSVNSMWIHMLSFALKSQIKLQRLKSIFKITMLMEKLS